MVIDDLVEAGLQTLKQYVLSVFSPCPQVSMRIIKGIPFDTACMYAWLDGQKHAKLVPIAFSNCWGSTGGNELYNSGKEREEEDIKNALVLVRLALGITRCGGRVGVIRCGGLIGGCLVGARSGSLVGCW